ncbi:MAG: efflux RND transporter periplasmic adaptor subunit [Salinisphaera sp.]|nr:efflux RND transporter periplasmic adaptor subunit [Salinisphaera sp.]
MLYELTCIGAELAHFISKRGEMLPANWSWLLCILLCCAPLVAMAHGDPGAFAGDGAVTSEHDTAAEIHAYPAQIRYDPRHRRSVVLKVSARLANLKELYVGRWVDKGQVLAQFESPGLETIQRTYVELYSNLAAARAFSNTVEKKLIHARMSLRWRGLSEQNIRFLERALKPVDQVQIRAPQGGYLTMITATEGQVVNAGAQAGRFSMSGTKLFEIADPNAILVEAALPRPVAASLQAGDRAWLRLPTHAAPIKAKVVRTVSLTSPGSLRRIVRVQPLTDIARLGVWNGLRITVSFALEPGRAH